MIRKLTNNENKSWYRLIEYHPRIPKLYDLPKIQKVGILMLPISGIGRAPHKLMKTLTKMLTSSPQDIMLKIQITWLG